jgi:hemolysin activation/secretion protein
VCAIAGLGLALIGAGAAYAQGPVPQTNPTSQQLNPGARAEAARRARATDVFSGAPPAVCSDELRHNATQFTLRAVEVRGAMRLSPQEERRAYEGMIGKSVPLGAVCEIADRISTMLFNKRLLAQVYLPDQKISPDDGRVIIQAVEARIVSVRYTAQGNVGPAQARVEAYLNRLRGLTPFDLDTANRYLLLANQVPGMKVQASLAHSTSDAPGADAAGALDLDVTISRKAENFVGAVENTSSKTLGPWSAIGRVDLNSFTSLGEETSLIGYSTLGNTSQEVAQIQERVLVGNRGLSAGGAFAYGWSRPGDVLAPLHLKGTSIVGTVEADYPVILLTRYSLTLGAGMDFIQQKTDFPGGGVLNDDNLRVLWARAMATGQHGFEPFSAGQFVSKGDLELDLRKGIIGLGSSHAGDPVLTRIQGQPDAFVLRAIANGSIEFEPSSEHGLGAMLKASLQGQWANKPLLAYEELAVGNLTIGRGYDPDALSGDRVVGGELWGQLGAFQLGRPLKVWPFGFYDLAYVTNLDTGSVDRTVRSIGGGARFQLSAYGHNLRADVYYAKPLDKTFPAQTTRPPARVLVQFVFNY